MRIYEDKTHLFREQSDSIMITKISDFNIKHNNTFGIDVQCRRWIEYTEADDLPAIFADAELKSPKSIGAGSNLLFTGDYDGDLLHSRIIDMDVTPLGNGMFHVRAGAGMEMDKLVEYCAERGFWGLENLSGIPGDVGASAVQNVGAYGVEASDCIIKVECFDTIDRRFVSFAPEECAYGYRTSRFKSGVDSDRYVICHVVFKVSSVFSPRLDYGHLKAEISNPKPTPMDVREAVIRVRNGKLPEVGLIGSAGSFFKNPVVDSGEFAAIQSRAKGLLGEDAEIPHYMLDCGVKIPAAWLIDKSGLKGYGNANAGVWSKQPLVIVNKTGNATARDVIDVERHVTETVMRVFGVELIPEVEHI